MYIRHVRAQAERAADRHRVSLGARRALVYARERGDAPRHQERLDPPHL